MDVLMSVVLVAALQSIGAHGQGLAQRGLQDGTRLFVATSAPSDLDVGALVEVSGQSPWSVQVTGSTAAGRVLRGFGDTLYVINEQDGSITRLRRDRTALPALELGASSRPQDIFVSVSGDAYVTPRDSGELLQVDMLTGANSVAANLGPSAAPDETLGVRMLHADSDHLLVQLGFITPAGASRGALAVFNMSSGSLVDADLQQPGVQAIELSGAPPHLKMQTRARRLFVSTTLNRMDNRGGIEMVDLDQLASVGFALTEAQISGLDLGGFTISGGVAPGQSLITVFGDEVEALLYDRARQQLYMPTGYAGRGQSSGIFVLDTLTDQVVPGSPFPTGMRAHDLVLTR
ncbi:MAG: hypothetical protein ACI8QZ_003117 [Chlamydiales bacterium]|jgi:hypothetical protein